MARPRREGCGEGGLRGGACLAAVPLDFAVPGTLVLLQSIVRGWNKSARVRQRGPTDGCISVGFLVYLCQQVFRMHTDSSHSNSIDKHIEVAALGHKMWQFINCFLQCIYIYQWTFTRMFDVCCCRNLIWAGFLMYLCLYQWPFTRMFHVVVI